MVARTAPAPSSEGALPEGEEKREAVRQMFDSIAPRYDLMNKAISLGLDAYWRRRALQLAGLTERARVLDLAAGTGDFARLCARRGLRPLALDYSAGMLAHARAGGAPLVLGDAALLPLRDASFDGVVSGFGLRNFADLGAALGEIARVLVPGGRIALLEVAEPSLPGFRQLSSFWFNRVVPRLGALASQAAAYRYLPASVAYLPPPGRLLDMAERAGLNATRRHLLSGGLVQVITAVRP